MKKYRIGNPIETDATVIKIEEESGQCPIFEYIWDADSFAVDVSNSQELIPGLRMELAKDDIVYGFGVSSRGMNKRGFVYTSNCSDDPNHTEEKNSLYSAHNFFIVQKLDRAVGVFADTPGLISFDVGFTKYDELIISFEDFDCDLYVIEEDSPTEVVSQFRQLIGESYVPPLWAFGLGQSRWSYRTADEVRELVASYEAAGIPLDSVYLDIDYMDEYMDFSVSDERFPDFAGFVREMKDKGIHLVPIIDAGVKIKEGYPTYEEGVKEGYFCKKDDGSDLVAAVWPGRVHFPDFLKEEVREWFGRKYKFLVDMGIDGFWNDMNEPAIFYTEDHLKEVFKEIDSYKDKNLDINSFFAFKDLVGKIDNNPEDYASFYHNYKGKKINHSKVHNLYGYNMTRAAGEALAAIAPDRKMLLFSRSSYIGMHRYGGIWTGDNRSWWSHLLMNIQQMPALSMSGFIYSGADTGGFSADCSRDLLLRWTAFSIFTPLFRNHSCDGTRRQEYTAFGDTEAFRSIIELRYALLPYIYSSFMDAVRNNKMYMAPLSFEYADDHRARNVQDQLLLGDSVMIAPVYTQNAAGRYVYLPEDMVMYRFRSVDDYDRIEITRGDHYIDVALEEVPIFIRKGKSVPFAGRAKRVTEVEMDITKIKGVLK